MTKLERRKDMPIKLVAVDMDGTLLKYDQTISAHTKEVIQKRVDEGLEFVLGTGRSDSECSMYYDELPIRYAIYSNGTYVIDRKTGKELYRRSIPLSDARKIYDIYNKYQNVIFIHADKYVYATEDFPTRCLSFPEYIARKAPIELPYIYEEDLGSFLDNRTTPIDKFHVSFMTHEDAVKAYEELKRLPYEVVFCGEFCVEVTHKEADKGIALDLIAKEVGIDKSDIMAIGDSDNDSSMVRYAGVGAAVGNAQQCLKDIADVVIPSNEEDGVAWALENLIG